MRNFEIHTTIQGEPNRAWEVMTDLSRYGEWSKLIPFAEGELSPGSRLNLRIRAPGGLLRPFRPTVVSITSPKELVLEATIGHRKLIHILHSFTLVKAESQLKLLQRWEATGTLVPMAWPLMRLGMSQFEEYGLDLNQRLN